MTGIDETSSTKKKWISVFVVLFLYFVFSLIFTYPLITNLNSGIPAGVYNDPMMFYWGPWNFMTSLLEPTHNPLISTKLFFPFEPNLAFHTYTLFRNSAMTLMSPFIHPVAAFNIVTILMYAFSGLGAYLLTLRFVKNRYAAFLSGFVFSFCPFKLARLQGHFNLIDSAFIPFFIIFLFKTFEEKKLSNPVLAGLFLALIGYCSYYYLIFAIFFTVFLFLYKWIPSAKPHITGKNVSEKTRLILKRINRLFGIPLLFFTFYVTFIGPVRRPPIRISDLSGIAVFSLLLFMVNIWFLYTIDWKKIFHDLRTSFLKLFSNGTVTRMVITVIVFAILFSPIIISILKYNQDYWLDLPLITNYPDVADMFQFSPFNHLGKLIHDRQFRGMERIVPIGFIAFFLSVFAFVKLRKKRSVKFWFFIGAMFTIFMLGPKLTLFGTKLISLPYKFFASVPFLSGARSPARYIIIVMLAMGILSAFAFEHLQKRLKERERKKIKPIVLLILILFFISAEYITVPIDMKPIDPPKFYYDIAEDGEQYTLLELPLWFAGKGFQIGWRIDRWGLSQAYQTVHGKNLISGYLAYMPKQVWFYYEKNRFVQDLATLQDVLRPKSEKKKHKILYSEPDPAARKFIQLMNIRYIVIHNEGLPEKTIWYLIKYLKRAQPDLKRVKKYKDLIIYRVKQADQNYFLNKNLLSEDYRISLLQGFSELPEDKKTITRRLTRKDARVIFPVVERNRYVLNIDFLANKEQSSRADKIELLLNKKYFTKITVKTGNGTLSRHRFEIPDELLKIGTNSLTIISDYDSEEKESVWLKRIEVSIN